LLGLRKVAVFHIKRCKDVEKIKSKIEFLKQMYMRKNI
jgi:hypothetical protein